jgi:transposase InsO family protein
MIAIVVAFLQIIARLLADLVGLIALSFKPRRSLEAENLFLRRELALFKERGITPRRVDAATRLSLALLSRLFDWRDALVVVRPETMVRWHRAGWRLFWRFRSRPGRPRGDQRWATFLRNHAKAIVACDFFVAVTATFRLVYVFVVIHHSSRRLLHFNVTTHPTAAWTLQQLREAIGFEQAHRYLVCDRDSIFAASLDESIKRLGLSVLKSPPHSPKANAICERVIGTITRDCLDWLIPLSEPHLRSMRKEWATHYNGARPHMALGPGVPDPPAGSVLHPNDKPRHRLGARAMVCARSVLGGLHHEYSLASALA